MRGRAEPESLAGIGTEDNGKAHFSLPGGCKRLYFRQKIRCRYSRITGFRLKNMLKTPPDRCFLTKNVKKADKIGVFARKNAKQGLPTPMNTDIIFMNPVVMYSHNNF